MTISELHTTYSMAELSSFPGNNQLRYELFSPLFTSLHENKIVYYEKFMSIVILEKVIITPERFEAIAVPYLKIEREEYTDEFYPEKSWKIGSTWDWMRLIKNYLSVPYVGWSIWPVAETVKKVEQLVLNKNYKEALKLTRYE